MAKPGVVKLNDHYKGDTFNGIQYTLLNSSDSSPIDLTGVSIKTQFRTTSKKGSVILEITSGSGITISDAVNGVFSFDSLIIDWSAGTYYYDVEITFSPEVIKSYIEGTIEILQDITNG